MKFSFSKTYINMPLPAKASFWFIVCSVIQKGIAFFTTPIFTRLLIPEEYGVIGVYNSWHSILTVFITLQLSTGVFNKAMIRYEGHRDQYTSSMLFLTSCATLLAYAIYLSAHLVFDKLFGLSFVLVSFIFGEIFFTEAMSFWSIRHRFEYEYKSVIFYTLASNIIGTGLSVILVLLIPQNRVLAKVGGTFAVHVLIYSYLYARIIHKGKKVIWPGAWKYAIQYNLPLIPHYLSQQILNHSDRIMIGMMCGAKDAAIYTIAYQMSMVLNIITSAISTSFTPWAYEKIKTKIINELGPLALMIVVFTGIGCLVFTLLAPELSFILGGNEYSDAIWVVPPVCMSVLFIMIYSLISTITFYFEKTKSIMMSSCLIAGLNILLNYIFIPMYGAPAGGYTTLVCYVVYSAVHYKLMSKTCKDNGLVNPFNTKLIFGTGIGFAIMAILCSITYIHTWMRYLLILFILVISITFSTKYGVYLQKFLRYLKKDEERY